MHKMLIDFFNTQENIRKTKENTTKQKTLIKLGLFEKEYSSENKYTPEYPHSEFDVNTSTYKYFKQVPIDITDEEYEKLKNYIDIDNQNNPVASLLNVIAWVIYISGIIAGITSGSFMWFVVFVICAIISGSLFSALSEIINLLTHIKNK